MFIRLWCRANEEIQANYAQFLKFSISKVIIYIYTKFSYLDHGSRTPSQSCSRLYYDSRTNYASVQFPGIHGNSRTGNPSGLVSNSLTVS